MVGDCRWLIDPAATALGLLCTSVCAASISAATALRAVLAAITIIAAVVDLEIGDPAVDWTNEPSLTGQTAQLAWRHL
jgi:hypothetical protein